MKGYSRNTIRYGRTHDVLTNEGINGSRMSDSSPKTTFTKVSKKGYDEKSFKN